MVEKLKDWDFIKTIPIAEVREQLALRDKEYIYSDQDVVNLFLDGCIGWNSLSIIDCIEAYVYAFCDKEEKFIVESESEKYEVIVDFPENLTNIRIILNGVDIYNN